MRTTAASPHTLRSYTEATTAAFRLIATRMLASGTDIMAVSELLGHASVATTQIYLKVDPARLAAAVEANPLARVSGPGTAGPGQIK